MKLHPFYFALCTLACGYLATANSLGWSMLPVAGRPALNNTSYRYRPSPRLPGTSSGSGGWFSGGGFHK